MYQSKFRKFKNINIFIPEEKTLIEKFIEFDENIFHRIDLNNKEIYWVKAWRLKIKYLQNVNNLLELICKLYHVYNKHKIVFIKKKFLELHRFIDFFFIWDAIGYFYNKSYEEYFSSFHQNLRYKFDNEPKKFLKFIEKINTVTKKDFSDNIKNLQKIKYKIKKI